MTIFSESQDHDRQRPAAEAVSRHGHQLHRNRERVGKHVAPCARSAAAVCSSVISVAVFTLLDLFQAASWPPWSSCCTTLGWASDRD